MTARRRYKFFHPDELVSLDRDATFILLLPSARFCREIRIRTQCYHHACWEAQDPVILLASDCVTYLISSFSKSLPVLTATKEQRLIAYLLARSGRNNRSTRKLVCGLNNTSGTTSGETNEHEAATGDASNQVLRRSTNCMVATKLL